MIFQSFTSRCVLFSTKEFQLLLFLICALQTWIVDGLCFRSQFWYLINVCKSTCLYTTLIIFFFLTLKLLTIDLQKTAWITLNANNYKIRLRIFPECSRIPANSQLPGSIETCFVCINTFYPLQANFHTENWISGFYLLTQSHDCKINELLRNVYLELDLYFKSEY